MLFNLYSCIINDIGQQLIQLPDGKLHVTSYINQTSSPRTVQIAKNILLTNNNNFTKTGAQVSFQTTNNLKQNLCLV